VKQDVISPKIRQLDALIAAATRVCIVVHARPDGDAAGSGAALLAYLRLCRGTDACLLFPDPLPEPLAFLAPARGVIVASAEPDSARTRIAGCDLLFCLDMHSFGRAEGLQEDLLACPAQKILIDHHPGPDESSFDLVFSETQVSSTCELLYQLLLAMEGGAQAMRLPLEVLTPLMAGMTTDTNNFANSVFPSTLQMASELLAAGVDRDALLDALFSRYRENRFRAMGYYLSELLHTTPDGVAYAVLDRRTAARFDLQEGETEGFVNLPLGIGRVRVSLLLREEEGQFRVSIRSKPGISANRLATEYFHGGGHECAAGGKLPFPQDIPGPERAAEYVETMTARFMRFTAPSQDELHEKKHP